MSVATVCLSLLSVLVLYRCGRHLTVKLGEKSVYQFTAEKSWQKINGGILMVMIRWGRTSRWADQNLIHVVNTLSEVCLAHYRPLNLSYKTVLEEINGQKDSLNSNAERIRLEAFVMSP